ncbi:MAG: polyphosphate kinase [Bacteroidetes bacterium]|nr:polyphosphate kinase [Bacteroidota bacterium]
MKIKDYPTINREWDKKKIQEKTKYILKEIGHLQYQMYAQKKYSLLIVLQGLDASGKDGLTRELLKYCNPIGFKIKSFTKPTAEEYAHDFLWRVHKAAPARGDIQVFVRSHYEDILVPSVEGYYSEEIIAQRYRLINDFEKLMEHHDTRILKFFLNVSPEKQKERLMERVQIKEKHWKHKDGDWTTREKFSDYLQVYDRIFRECNEIPWHMVPSDTNWQKLYFVASEVLKTMRNLKLEWPDLKSELFNKDN